MWNWATFACDAGQLQTRHCYPSKRVWGVYTWVPFKRDQHGVDKCPEKVLRKAFFCCCCRLITHQQVIKIKQISLDPEVSCALAAVYMNVYNIDSKIKNNMAHNYVCT